MRRLKKKKIECSSVRDMEKLFVTCFFFFRTPDASTGGTKDTSIANGSIDLKTSGNATQGGSDRGTAGEASGGGSGSGNGGGRQRLGWGMGAVSAGFVVSAEVQSVVELIIAYSYVLPDTPSMACRVRGTAHGIRYGCRAEKAMGELSALLVSRVILWSWSLRGGGCGSTDACYP